VIVSESGDRLCKNSMSGKSDEREKRWALSRRDFSYSIEDDDTGRMKIYQN
jgi:hypothetical protein